MIWFVNFSVLAYERGATDILETINLIRQPYIRMNDMKLTHIDDHTSSTQTSLLLRLGHPRKDIPDITLVATSSETVTDNYSRCIGRKFGVILRRGINAPDLVVSENKARNCRSLQCPTVG